MIFVVNGVIFLNFYAICFYTFLNSIGNLSSILYCFENIRSPVHPPTLYKKEKKNQTTQQVEMRHLYSFSKSDITFSYIGTIALLLGVL